MVAVLCAAVTVSALAGGGGKAATHGFSAAMSDEGHDHHDHSHDGEDEPSRRPATSTIDRMSVTTATTRQPPPS